MEPNENIRHEIFEAVEKQIKDNNPPETKTTYDRLRKEGYTDFQTKQLIGQCILFEIYDAFENEKPFNNERYVQNLKNLPEEAVD